MIVRRIVIAIGIVPYCDRNLPSLHLRKQGENGVISLPGISARTK